MFVTKMLVETVNGIGTGGIAGTDFLAKRGHRGLCAAIVMEQRVKNIEGIFWRLPTGKGAKFPSLAKAPLPVSMATRRNNFVAIFTPITFHLFIFS